MVIPTTSGSPAANNSIQCWMFRYLLDITPPTNQSVKQTLTA